MSGRQSECTNSLEWLMEKPESFLPPAGPPLGQIDPRHGQPLFRREIVAFEDHNDISGEGLLPWRVATSL